MRNVQCRLLILGGAVALAGCMGTIERPGAGQLQEGLNLLDVRDAEWGSNAAYVKNGRVVYIETRIGAMKPEIYRQTWPEDSSHEIDVRFVDQNGRTFFVQRGGDNYVDPLWHADIAAHQGKPVDRRELDIDFQIAKEAAAAYRVGVPATFVDHAAQMVAIEQEPVPSKNPALQKLAKEATQAERADETAYFNWGWAGANASTSTQLYSASTGCFAWICTARHSATRMFVNGAAYYNNCNHGRCYNGSGMGYHCSSSGRASASGNSLTGETNSNTTAVSGGCATPYNWNSGGYDHLCNSDAAYELWQGKEGRYNTSRGDHYSFTWDNGGGNYACNCNNNSDCDGDWKRPGCP